MGSVGIIGAGLTGLTAAHQLRERGWTVTVYEAAARVGGAIDSVRRDGFLIEAGPNTARETPELSALIDELGLRSARLQPDPAARHRYLVRHGRALAAPTGPGALLRSPLLSVRAKLRLLAEPWVRQRRASTPESLAAFVTRRLGAEVLRYAVDPVVAGIFAGDPAQLAVAHAFPRLVAWEQHGSILRGALAARRQARGARRAESISLRDGWGMLPRALAARLGDAVRLNHPVTALRPDGSGWLVTAGSDGQIATERHEQVIFAGPIHRLPPLLPFVTDTDRARFAAVPHPPVTVLALGFRRADVAHPLDGFGLLVPSAEPFSILGALFSSTLFPNRAPADQVLLTVFLGGTRHPALGTAPLADQLHIARADLGALLGVRGEPTHVSRTVWPHAIPQYTLAHGEVLSALDRLEADHAGLHFAGTFRGGIALGNAVAAGERVAARIAGEKR